jgi:sigma-B regulation protein RsbU (phosphoserine phosphatase)
MGRILDIPRNDFYQKSQPGAVSISRLMKRLKHRGRKMLTDTVMMEAGSEWAIACEVQQRFMQRLDPEIDTLDYSAQCRQAHELGGDCYNFVPLTDNRLALAIGDASGKGLAAALMISNVQSSLRTAASFTGDDTAAVLAAVNRQVYATSLDDRYATLFYGVFDGATSTLRYVNGGHNPPMVIRRDGSVVWLETGGAPVGMFPHWTYEEAAVQMNPGDVVVAYTDGVTEVVNPAGKEWGVEGLRRAVAESGTHSADGIVHAIFNSMDEFSHGRQTDDATVVVLRVV